ncbi:MAG TPA: GDP-mannose 4,6-dehydratase [Myxococcota bacterium]|nr:GDP-mannose 4,6-dehydratase [Myxococcota bacterium]
MRVLVSGGAGFVGAATVRLLLAEGHDVVVLDDLSTGRRDVLREDVVFHHGDVRDQLACRRAVQGCDALVHLAALSAVPESFVEPVRFDSVNDGGTASILDAAWGAGVRRVVLASSAAVYGEGGSRPLREEDPFDPRSPYAASKVGMEALGRVYAHRGVHVGLLRYFNVFGPGASANSVVPRFVLRARAGLPFEIEGDGEQLRDFIHVEDVARANVLALRRSAGTVNIGSGRATSIRELADAIGVLFGSPGVRRVGGREHDLRKSVADVRRARRHLGWSPRIELEEGLRELLEATGGVHRADKGS